MHNLRIAKKVLSVMVSSFWSLKYSHGGDKLNFHT